MIEKIFLRHKSPQHPLGDRCSILPIPMVAWCRAGDHGNVGATLGKREFPMPAASPLCLY
jgi:hypothetical protein